MKRLLGGILVTAVISQSGFLITFIDSNEESKKWECCAVAVCEAYQKGVTYFLAVPLTIGEICLDSFIAAIKKADDELYTLIRNKNSIVSKVDEKMSRNAREKVTFNNTQIYEYKSYAKYKDSAAITLKSLLYEIHDLKLNAGLRKYAFNSGTEFNADIADLAWLNKKQSEAAELLKGIIEKGDSVNNVI